MMSADLKHADFRALHEPFLASLVAHGPRATLSLYRL